MSHVEPSTIAVAEEALKAFDALTGPQPGFRPAHAKGILLAGSFTPAAEAKSLTRAPHVLRSTTPVSVRFSDFAGIPSIPDNHEQASPRGFALRFHLDEHSHTDIIGHSVDGFPVRTVEDFVEFLHALGASGPNAAKPTPIEKFLGAHPAALRFVQTPQPMPTSFAKQAYFGVNAYRFINANDASQFGRFRIRPEGSTEYLDQAAAQKATPNFLFDEIEARLAKGPVKMRIAVQVAAKGDVVDDATVHWPADRPEVEFGTVELTTIIPNNAEEQRRIIFDPIPRVDGIESSADPLLEPRATIYLFSGRRRRAAGENIPAAPGNAR